jgi:predicted RNase H-like HicB family nuclease
MELYAGGVTMTLHQHNFTAAFKRSGGWWAAWIEELPGANSQGRTIEEARENLREAALMMLEDEEDINTEYEEVADDTIREPLIIAH